MIRLLHTANYLEMQPIKEIVYCKWACNSFYIDSLTMGKNMFGSGESSKTNDEKIKNEKTKEEIR